MKESAPSEERWRLTRQDDHGNQFVMEIFDSKQQAEGVMAHYQGKGHKQTYWVEKARDGECMSSL